MTQVIVYTNESGNVNVTVPTGEISIEDVLAKDCPSHAIIVEKSELPYEHYDFFNAWELKDGAVKVSHPKAQGITKTRLRNERVPLLAEQDALFQKAQEEGTGTNAIFVEKQRLRDVTKLADKATTLDELRALSA